jgi:hypothetical protein
MSMQQCLRYVLKTAVRLASGARDYIADTCSGKKAGNTCKFRSFGAPFLLVCLLLFLVYASLSLSPAALSSRLDNRNQSSGPTICAHTVSSSTPPAQTCTRAHTCSHTHTHALLRLEGRLIVIPLSLKSTIRRIRRIRCYPVTHGSRRLHRMSRHYTARTQAILIDPA